jgi:hypothetical protein
MWYAFVAVLGVFAGIGALTGALEGAGLGAMLRAAGRLGNGSAGLRPALDHGA